MSLQVPGAAYHDGLEFAQYREIGAKEGDLFCVNSTLLKEPTVLHAKMKMHENKDGEALSLGDALHKAVLEPEVFETRFEEFYQTAATATWGTKANERLKELYPGKVVLTEEMIDKVRWMRDAIFRCHLARQILDQCDQRELSGVIPDNGFMRKIRVDLRPSRWDYLADIKTGRDMLPAAFRADAFKRGYHVQGQFYLDCDAMITGRRRKDFHIIGVQNCKPFFAGVLTIPHQVDPTDSDTFNLETGEVLYRHRMAALVHAVAKNEWHGPYDHQQDPLPLVRGIELP